VARIVVRELEPLEIVFNDNVLTCLLNNDAIMFLTEEFGDINKLMEKEKDKPFDLAAKLLYCGVKLGDASFTCDEARRIVLSGGMNLVIALLDNFVDAFKVNATDEELEIYAGELERILKK